MFITEAFQGGRLPAIRKKLGRHLLNSSNFLSIHSSFGFYPFEDSLSPLQGIFNFISAPMPGDQIVSVTFRTASILPPMPRIPQWGTITLSPTTVGMGFEWIHPQQPAIQ
jgi:hypothetical protein